MMVITRESASKVKIYEFAWGRTDSLESYIIVISKQSCWNIVMRFSVLSLWPLPDARGIFLRACPVCPERIATILASFVCYQVQDTTHSTRRKL